MRGRLGDLDPTSVPLPNGTEVSTRVDRLDGERVVPQGAIGRVQSSDGERVQVRVVGVGVLEYARRELLPRKLGQARYAERRAAGWDTLLPCVVLDATVGSRAWGLADEGSDTDMRGVFALPFAWRSGLVDGPEELVSLDASTTYWEVRKMASHALRADPNTLEMLFVPTARARDPIGEWILEARDAFVSREIYGAFGRYAISQLEKLGQSLRLAEHRGIVLAWLREDPDLTLDATAHKLADAVIHDAPTRGDALLRAKQYIKQLYRSLYDQGLLPARDLDALKRFAREDPAAIELPRELRPKNAYNLLRLLRSAIDWLTTGEPHLTVSGAFRDRLRAVKLGQVPLAEVLAEAEAMTPELEAARQAARVPDRPDRARVDQLLRRVSEALARRAIEAAPGPWGRDAAPPPPIEEVSEEEVEPLEDPPEPASAAAQPPAARADAATFAAPSAVASAAPSAAPPTSLRLGDPARLGLRPEQWAVTRRVLAEEDALRRHLVIALSGAHAYGFPSPDSDVDLKSIHIAPTRDLLALSPRPGGRERLEVIDGVEIDFSANELGTVLAGVVAGNGNFIERILGPRWAAARPELDALQPIVARSLSRRLHRHYLGFATSQLRDVDAAPAAPAKRVLYVLRTALTGLHALRTGEVVADLRELADEYGFADAHALIAAKTAGERSVLTEAESDRWRVRVRDALAALTAARDASPLPDAAPNVGEVDAWLLEVRRAG